MTALPEDIAALKRVRDRLATPDQWTKGAMARNSRGHETGWAEPDAVCWCLYGAGEREHCSTLAYAALGSVLDEWVGHKRIAEWQDAPYRDLEDVHALIDRAIERMEATP